jgi:hypothetical protein
MKPHSLQTNIRNYIEAISIALSLFLHQKKECIMFHTISKNSKKRLFCDHQEAFHLLLGIQLYCEKHTIVLIDYLLVENHLEMLIKANEKQAASLAAYLDSKASLICASDLLVYFKKLSSKGKEYRLSGTFELYHHSWCFSELGKTGSAQLPIPLWSILKIKNC